jgi:hypothetical protein
MILDTPLISGMKQVYGYFLTFVSYICINSFVRNLGDKNVTILRHG